MLASDFAIYVQTWLVIFPIKIKKERATFFRIFGAVIFV
jgi:hypothetical protein